jgi:hypothetical protein
MLKAVLLRSRRGFHFDVPYWVTEDTAEAYGATVHARL